MVKENKEIQVKESMLPEVATGTWGAGEDIGSEDLITPMILVGQSTSNAVKEGSVKYGELYDSLTRRVLAGKGESLDIIVFKTRKKWFVTKGPQFAYIEEFTAENANAPYEFTVNGETFTRSLCLEFLCVLPKDIKESPEETFPFYINFMKSNRQAGKVIATIVSKLRMANRPSASVVFTITAKTQTNDKKQEYFVLDVKQGRNATNEEIAVAKKWYDLSITTTFIADDVYTESAPTVEAKSSPQAKASTKANIEDDLQF